MIFIVILIFIIIVILIPIILLIFDFSDYVFFSIFDFFLALDGGDTPSEPRLDRMPSKDAGKALAAAQDIIVHHLRLHACSALRRMGLASFLARARANNPMKRRVSYDQRPATSPANTTSLAAPSRANQHLSSSPILEQAARWWPKASKGRPHLQKREDRGVEQHTEQVTLNPVVTIGRCSHSAI